MIRHMLVYFFTFVLVTWWVGKRNEIVNGIKRYALGKEWGSEAWKWIRYELFLELSRDDHTINFKKSSICQF